MRMKLLTLIASALLFSPLPALAQMGQSAALTGTVTDATGAILPGVTVTAASESLIGGSRSAPTDVNGVYRFPALPPGLYTVTAELSNFRKSSQEARLELGQTVTLDVKLEVGGLTDVVEVAGSSPTVDAKSSSADKNLPTEFLELIPFSSRFGPGAMLIAPGVNPTNYSAYGSGGSSSNALLIDGVDVGDPEGGTIWVFASHNWLQEVQISGLGANAEYGGFTGRLVEQPVPVRQQPVPRACSRRSTRTTGSPTATRAKKSWRQNPDRCVSATTNYVTDTTFQIGGPVQAGQALVLHELPVLPSRDIAIWVSADHAGRDSGHQHRAECPPREVSPRFLFKPTMKLGESDQLTGFFQAERYTVEGRGPARPLHRRRPSAEDSAGVAWNANYTKVLSSTAVFDVRYAGFWGYYYLQPYNGDDTPGWYDVEEDFYAVNWYYFYKADRTRNQAERRA